MGYATAGPGGGASMNNGKFGGDGGDGIYGAGGGGAGAGYVSAGATVDGYRANVFGGVGGNGYVSIEYLFF